MQEGFVFAASGAAYLPLTIRAAESIRRHHADHPIDLFTDQPCDAPVFSKVHRLEAASFRPKFEALQRSRFGRTLCLDADIICTASMADVFELLHRFDIAAAHEPNRNADWAIQMFRTPVPPAFPQVNSGVIGCRASEQTRGFFADLSSTLRDSGLNRDQPILRELLYASGLRLAILPPEYNLMEIDVLEAQGRRNTAPRLLHAPRLHKHLRTTRRRRELRTVTELCGSRITRHIDRMIAADRTLGNSGRARPLLSRGLLGLVRFFVNDIPRGVRRLLARY